MPGCSGHRSANGQGVPPDLAAPGAPGDHVRDYKTICKWAFGTSDTYALGILAEMTGTGIRAIVLPYVNAALAERAPFRRSVESLRDEGVRILLGPGGPGRRTCSRRRDCLTREGGS